MSESAAHAALNIFRGSGGKFQLQQVEHLGFSGSALWRVTSPDEPPLCLKRWPASHPPPARLPWIHQVLIHSRQQGIDFLPKPQVTRAGQTTCDHAGSTWELMTWLPGSVDDSPTPSAQRVAAAFHALAKFHRATADFDQKRAAKPAPAIADRVNRWQVLSGGEIAVICQAIQQRSIPAIDDLAQEWIARHSTLPREMLNGLTIACQLSLPLQPAIRDLWRDHVLFQEEKVSGVIDFGAMRMDTPLTDLGRLIGSLAKDDATLRETALGAYGEISPLSPSDRQLIDLLDHSGTLIAGWNWLAWLYVEQREFPSLVAVRERLAHLLRRTRVR